MSIHIERVYESHSHAGYRVLVDRIWPRGITKEEAALDEWCKELAPSTTLRKWFGHKAEHWAEFQKRYTHELQQNTHEAHALLERAKGKKLVLLYGAKDKDHTHAIVLKAYLEKLG